jgi:hypothetical protein
MTIKPRPALASAAESSDGAASFVLRSERAGAAIEEPSPSRLWRTPHLGPSPLLDRLSLIVGHMFDQLSYELLDREVPPTRRRCQDERASQPLSPRPRWLSAPRSVAEGRPRRFPSQGSWTHDRCFDDWRRADFDLGVEPHQRDRPADARSSAAGRTTSASGSFAGFSPSGDDQV